MKYAYYFNLIISEEGEFVLLFEVKSFGGIDMPDESTFKSFIREISECVFSAFDAREFNVCVVRESLDSDDSTECLECITNFIRFCLRGNVFHTENLGLHGEFFDHIEIRFFPEYVNSAL